MSQAATTTARVTLQVTGMTCASCVRRIEKALVRVPGVSEAAVNLVSERASVTFDPELATRPALESAIERAGYGVRPEPAPARGARHAAGGGRRAAAGDLAGERERDISDLRSKALVSLAIGLGMMLLMFLPVSLDMSIVAPALLVVATAVQVWAGGRFYRAAWQAARHGTTTMDTLVAAGTSVAYGYSAFVTLWPQLASRWGMPLELYYETAVIIVALVLLGRWLEARARSRTGAAIRALSELQPAMATVVAGDGEREVRIEALEVGDLVRVRPGQRVPVDGVVVDGRSAVDERMLTGESLPVERAAGDPLIGGTLNGSGALVARVARVGDDTALAQIVALVEDAQGSLPPSQRLADTVSAYFVPGILAVAVVTFAGWMLLGPEPRLPAALQAAVAVLIVACPCALGLATPTAVMVAAGRAAEMGILVRSGEALERARRIDTMVLDKTGTLTRGRPVVSRVVPASGWTEEELLAIAAAAELGSEHPVGEAVVAHARESGVEPAVASAFEALAGQGVSATVDRREVLAGSPRLMRRLGIELDGMADASRELVAMGGTSMLVAVDRRPAGVIGVTDSLKPGAAETVRQLREMGLDVWMVTGDGRGVAEAVAREAGIEHVLAEVLPHEKADQIRELQSRGHRVAMVGDGINDAPALAQADVGIAIGTGADVALAASDITLVGGDLAGIVTALALSRRTVAVIQQGLFWAFAYNLLLVPLATGALFPLVRVLLTPALAAAAMALSSVSVVTNALRLRRFRRPDRVRDIVRPPLTARLREVGYLASIALVAGGIGAASLGAVQRAAVGATAVPAAQAGIHARLSIPAGVQPDVPARLVYRLSSASDGGPFTGVVASHDRLMHLVVVASDLARFQHLHPIPTGAPGEYAVDVRFPVAGSYQLFDEFATAAGQDVVLRDSVTVTGARPATVPLRSDSSPKVRGDYSVALLGAGDLLWGRPSRLTFSVTSAATGLPAHNLRPYLGAAAHVSIVRQDASWFLHAHGMSPGSAPMTMGMGLAAGPGAGGGHSDAAGEVGPRIDVEPAFPGPGLYKIWGQFEAPDGSVITADYVVRVH